jgi:hypothetical protein
MHRWYHPIVAVRKKNKMFEHSVQEENPRGIVGAVRRLGTLALFRRDVPITSTRAVIGWWETRRIPYNLIVGSAGILTCIVIAIVGIGSNIFFNSDFGLPDPPLFAIFGVIIYGILANFCFTGGWLAELIVQRAWPEEANRFATTSFSLGLFLSVLLTLTPAILVGVVGIFKLVSHLLGVVHQ